MRDKLRRPVKNFFGNSREKTQAIHFHAINAKNNITLSCDQLFWNLDVVVDYWCRRASGCLPFKRANVGSKNLLCHDNILRRDRIISDDIHPEDRLEIVHRWRPQSVIQVSRFLRLLKLAVREESFIFFDCVQQLHLCLHWRLKNIKPSLALGESDLPVR